MTIFVAAPGQAFKEQRGTREGAEIWGLLSAEVSAGSGREETLLRESKE